MTPHEMIVVLRAYDEGKKIQGRAKEGPEHKAGWKDVFPNWDFYRVDFRVKPEPREWWAHVHGDGSGDLVTSYQKKNCSTVITNDPDSYYNIRVREVLP